MKWKWQPLVSELLDSTCRGTLKNVGIYLKISSELFDYKKNSRAFTGLFSNSRTCQDWWEPWHCSILLWANMLSANQIIGFLNEVFLQNKLTKLYYFLHVDTNSQKLKVDQNFLVGHRQRSIWPIRPILTWQWTDGINWYFTRWYKFTQIKRWLKFFWRAWSKMGAASLVTRL